MANKGSSDFNPYDVLGVSKESNRGEIKKAYHKLALKYHPDKVPIEERPAAEIDFKEVHKAYEILYDDEKRKLYDVHGMDAFDGSGPGMSEEEQMNKIFEMFGFAGMGGMGGGPQAHFKGPMKGRSEQQPHKATLEDLYKGKTTKYRLQKDIVCPTCRGTGGKGTKKPHDCGVCGGTGSRTTVRSMGNGMMAQQEAMCSTCLGEGKIFEEKDRCKKCKGRRVIKTAKSLEVYLPPGSKHRENIVFAGETDQVPGQEPGDLIFTIVQEDHDIFQRHGADLETDLHVTLLEALAGFNRVVVTHLDGRGLRMQLSQPRGKILKPGQILKVPGEGMPIKGSDAKGDLYLRVIVDFPENGLIKETETIQALKDILPKPKQPISSGVVTDVEFEVATEEDMEGAMGGDWEDEDEDNDEYAGGATQCAAQ